MKRQEVKDFTQFRLPVGLTSSYGVAVPGVGELVTSRAIFCGVNNRDAELS